MAYLSKLEESTQRFVQTETASAFPMTLGNGNRWDTPLSGQSFTKKNLELTSSSSVILSSLAAKIVSLETWSPLFSSSLGMDRSTEKDNDASFNWSSRSRILEVSHQLNLSLQLLSMEIWDARNSVVHGFPTLTWRNVSDLTDLLTVFSELKGVLEQTNRLQSSSQRGIHLLEEMYVFRKAVDIYSFLKVNPFLVPLLLEANTHIRSYFPSSKITLEVVADPETTDDDQLVIFIAADSNIEQATESLDKLDEEWWLDVLEQAQGKLCITLEFL